jgi:hypothetical protein
MGWVVFGTHRKGRYTGSLPAEVSLGVDLEDHTGATQGCLLKMLTKSIRRGSDIRLRTPREVTGDWKVEVSGETVGEGGSLGVALGNSLLNVWRKHQEQKFLKTGLQVSQGTLDRLIELARRATTAEDFMTLHREITRAGISGNPNLIAWVPLENRQEGGSYRKIPAIKTIRKWTGQPELAPISLREAKNTIDSIQECRSQEEAVPLDHLHFYDYEALIEELAECGVVVKVVS